VIQLLYVQAVLWLTIPYAPMMVLWGPVMFYLSFKFDKFVTANLKRKPVRMFSAKNIKQMFFIFYLLTLLIFMAVTYLFLSSTSCGVCTAKFCTTTAKDGITCEKANAGFLNYDCAEEAVKAGKPIPGAFGTIVYQGTKTNAKRCNCALAAAGDVCSCSDINQFPKPMYAVVPSEYDFANSPVVKSTGFTRKIMNALSFPLVPYALIAFLMQQRSLKGRFAKMMKESSDDKVLSAQSQAQQLQKLVDKQEKNLARMKKRLDDREKAE